MELADGIEGVRRDDDRARLQRAEEAVDELGAVWEDQRHTVAFSDIEPLEAGGEAAREVVKVLV